MIKTSTKKLFFYISVSLVLCYFVFVLLVYNEGKFPELYNLEQSGLYYMFVYLLLVATNYVIDTQTRKEPAYLTLFCLPTFTLFYLSSVMLMSGVYWTIIVVLLLIMSLVYILGYYCYKKWIEKILMIKNGYDNILLAYVIIHLFIVLFVSFKISCRIFSYTISSIFLYPKFLYVSTVR